MFIICESRKINSRFVLTKCTGICFESKKYFQQHSNPRKKRQLVVSNGQTDMTSSGKGRNENIKIWHVDNGVQNDPHAVFTFLVIDRERKTHLQTVVKRWMPVPHLKRSFSEVCCDLNEEPNPG